jgi:8-oxo-dGTP pyrophosphatase MutT (NUDIX family)
VLLSERPPPIPGATVVPLRDGPGGLEVLLVRRAATIAYGGMWAFPGGRVDPADAGPDGPDTTGGPDDGEGYEAPVVAAARRAAVREAREEVGLAFAAGDLVAYSHWTGGANQARLYAAWYFLAPAPAGAVVLDGRETVDHRWIGPAAAVAARDAGEVDVVAPTWMTLHSLAGVDSVAGALALARSRRPVVYLSRLVVRPDADARGRGIVLWHGDAGYAAGDPDRPGARHRLVMADDGWTFERSPGPA